VLRRAERLCRIAGAGVMAGAVGAGGAAVLRRAVRASRTAGAGVLGMSLTVMLDRSS
jgi:hypothetical protein